MEKEKNHSCFTGELIFEVEFLNGEKITGTYYIQDGDIKSKYNKIINEIRKEYSGFTCNLTFEGEYLNGLPNGKGKEYKNGKLKFENEFLNEMEKWKKEIV